MEDNKLVRRPMFNEHGDITLDKRKMVGGNTTNYYSALVQDLWSFRTGSYQYSCKVQQC